MLKNTSFLIAISVSSLFTILLLLRKKKLREKYAGIWILFIFFVLLILFFPTGLSKLSTFVGFEVTSNFFFFLSIAFLTFLAMQLSVEVGKLENENQKLAEEVALIKIELESKE